MKKRMTVYVSAILITTVAINSVYAGNKKKIVDVFILAGQSNAVGFNNADTYKGGKEKFDEIFIRNSTVLFWPGSNAVKDVAGRWVPLQTGVGENSAEPPYKNAFGPEVGFAQTIKTLIQGREIAIIKYAVGGTGIARSSDYDDYIPSLKGFDDKGRNWHFPEKGKATGELYKNLMQNIQSAIDALEKDNKKCRVRGFIWMQGEHEAGISKSMANDYKKLLSGFIRSVRHDLHNKDLPVVIGQINLNAWAFGDVARQRQIEYCATDPHSKLIITTDLTRNGNGDTAHFDAEGMLALGERFAREMAALLIHAKEN